MERSLLEELLAGMVRSGASRLYLMPGQAPFVRLQDSLVHLEGLPLSPQVIEDLTREFLFEDYRESLARGEELQFLYVTRSGERFRTTAQRQEGGLGLVFRRVPNEIPSFEDLGLPELVSSFVEFQRGLVIITGFLGSGKSTTLASMIDRLNRDSTRRVITIEKPIDYIYQQSSALIHQREVGIHVGSFAEGIGDAMRHGADVLVVGDLQDHETLVAALDAAERGLLVFTTVHASGVVGGLYDLMSMCPVDERPRIRVRLASALRAVMSQTLIKRSQTKGRVPLLEILINNESVRRELRAGNFHQLPAIMDRSRGLGMQSEDQGLRMLLSRKLITMEEALYHANDRSAITTAGRAPSYTAR